MDDYIDSSAEMSDNDLSSSDFNNSIISKLKSSNMSPSRRISFNQDDTDDIMNNKNNNKNRTSNLSSIRDSTTSYRNSTRYNK